MKITILNQPFTLFLAMLAAAVLSYGLTFLVRMFAVKIGAIDTPRDNRRMHKTPTPLLGGIAIYFGFSAVSLLFCEFTPFLRSLLIGSTIIVLTGVIDDLFDLNPWFKLAAETAAALLVISEGTAITDLWLFGGRIALPRIVSVLLTALWIVGLSNATNLIDGLDGLSAGVCSISAISLAIISALSPTVRPAWTVLLLLVMAGATLGYLPHNFAAKKIFMGDTGALLLGFILACLSIQGVFKTQAVLSFVAPVAVFSLPIFDTGFSYFRRVFKGQNPFKADRKHLHHRLVAIGFSQHGAVFFLWGITLFMCTLAVTLYLFNADPLLSLLIVFFFLFGLYLIISYKSGKAQKRKPKAAAPAIRRLKRKKLFLLDMDGTLYVGNRLFKATTLFLEYVRKSGGTYYYLTNNSSKSAADYVRKLESMGVHASESDFITSVQAMSEVLSTKYALEKIYVLGTESFRRELERDGFHVVTTPDDDVRCLVVGFDTELTYGKLTDACKLLRRPDVEYLATNPDWVCPVEGGSIPDCGSICQMLENATGRTPTVVGKPGTMMVELALRRSGLTKEDALIIGDRLYTDIACGIEAGIDSAFVLSGEGSLEDLAESGLSPTYTFHSVGELIQTVVQSSRR